MHATHAVHTAYSRDVHTAYSRDKFHPCHWPLLALLELECVVFLCEVCFGPCIAFVRLQTGL